jgi:hypothetical protein
MSTFAATDVTLTPHLPLTTRALAIDVHCTEDALHVRLADGREISAPLEWYPRLRNATVEQRKNWRLIGHGLGIHWEEVDEDISVEGLLKL